ncbi:MAG: hypothetical protein ACOYVF_04395 [Candidatus Zixiibacteriota bacterium]
MKFLKIIIAVLLTFLMLYVTRQNSRGRSEYYTHSENGYAFEMYTVPKVNEYESDTIVLTVTMPPESKAQLWFLSSEMEHYTQRKQKPYTEIPMAQLDSAAHTYASVVTAGPRGGRLYYYFEVIDAAGKTRATFKPPDGKPFLLKYIGRVPIWIVVLHITFLFATVFCVSMATVNTFAAMSSGKSLRPAMVFIFWAVLFTFLGMIPFGIPMNYYAFDVTWEAVPFGTDATDNKTQLIFFYLLFVLLAGWKSFRGKGRDIYPPKTLAIFTVGAFFVMMFIYLIPHSIQFSETLTYAFCYGFIALVVFLYLTGYCKKEKKAV